jgi:hypothetical protein
MIKWRFVKSLDGVGHIKRRHEVVLRDQRYRLAAWDATGTTFQGKPVAFRETQGCIFVPQRALGVLLVYLDLVLECEDGREIPFEFVGPRGTVQIAHQPIGTPK